jgi:hypothetical protein
MMLLLYTGGGYGMRLDSGADRIIVLKDAQTKAIVADLEVKAAGGSRLQDTQAALSNSDVVRRVRNELIAGVAALICLAALTYVFFFIVLD